MLNYQYIWFGYGVDENIKRQRKKCAHRPSFVRRSPLVIVEDRRFPPVALLWLSWLRPQTLLCEGLECKNVLGKDEDEGTGTWNG